MSRFALKQTYYNANNQGIKQSAGFLTGKEGLDVERSCLHQCLAAGVPALLVDLTNSIRFGDLCLMVGPDPILKEIKTTNKLDKRGRRQRDEIKLLQTFLDEDVIENLRGFSKIHRTISAEMEKDYIDNLNSVVSEARNKGVAKEEPERGLHYIAFCKGGDIESLMSSIKVVAPWVVNLNEQKISREWAPYVPPTLILESFANFYAFIHGDVYIIVVVDFSAILAWLSERNCRGTLSLDSEDYPLQIEAEDGQTVKISWHMFRRVGMECISPIWILETALHTLSKSSEFADK